MPYCWKCGAELDEDAKFCPRCGTSVGPSDLKRPEREKRKPLKTLNVVLAALVVAAVAMTVIVLAFLPLRALEDQRRHTVPYETSVNRLNLEFTADVAQINIVFEENLTGFGGRLAVSLHASAAAKGGIFVSPDFFEKEWFRSSDKKVDNTVTVTSEVDVVDEGWPWFSSLNVTCDVRVDSSMNTSLSVETSTGGIVLYTHRGMVLKQLYLESTTGGVEANLVEDVFVTGNISIKTVTGGAKLSWQNVVVPDDIQVDVKAATGGVEVNVNQDERLLGNVNLKGEVTTGGVDFAIDIRGDIGAEIESSTSLGGIDIDRQIGFSGTEALLQSKNYPASSNFDVTLKTATGGIDIDAKCTP